MQALRPGRIGTGDTGQSLIEAAIILPFLFLLVFNAINFAYFFYVAIHLASAPRDAAEYSIQGSATPSSKACPAAGPSTTATTVSSLAYQNLVGLPGGDSATLQICSRMVGTSGTGTSQTSACSKFPSASSYVFPTPAVDQEAPRFILQRVDVVYTVQPLIPAQPFGITLLPTYTLHRQVSMRAMGC